MDKTIQRVYKYLNYKDLKPAQFEREIGLSNGYLSKQYNRNADLGESIIIKILENCPEISPTWLLTGEGSMLKGGEGKEVAEAKEPGNKGNINDYLLEYIELLKEKLAKVEADLEEHRQRTKSAATQAERKSA